MIFYPICKFKKFENNKYICTLTTAQKFYNCPINETYNKCECFKCVR